MEIRLDKKNGKVVVLGFKDGTWIPLFYNPRFTITGEVMQFRYEDDQLIISEMKVEHLKVVPRFELPN